jgi:ParB family transcriptional regulator, chromosome partitioning protein
MGKQALEGKRLNAFALAPEELVIIGLDTPHKKGEHPLWDERIHLPIDENMVLNIMAEGVHEPVLVRKNGDTPEVVNGRQRIRHAREANKRLTGAGKEPVTVKVIVERGSDERMFGVMISTNEVRREDAFEAKLAKLERYLAMGKSEQQAAIVFGVSVATIKNWLAVVEAGPEVKAAVKTGELAPTAAAKIAKLPRQEQAAVVQEARETGAKLTGERAARAAKTVTEGTPAIEKPSPKVVKRLLATESALEIGTGAEYHAGFVDALKWLRGELATKKVKGLQKALNSIGDEDKVV